MLQLDELDNSAHGIRDSDLTGQRSRELAQAQRAMPRISVIVRSMDRTMLQEALGSIATQTYSNVDVVVVNATGRAHSALGDRCGTFPLRLVHGTGPVGRAAAANIGMARATGEYLIFLDDDDLFLADHLEKLSRELVGSAAQACYTGVRLVGADGQILSVLDEPWEADRLRVANFLPIHAVLFERALLSAGCQFREDLECLEDWDFWLQIGVHTAFHHVPEVSAVYRMALGTSGLSAEANAEQHITNRARIFEAWLPRFTSREWVRSIHWFENARSHFYQMALDRFHENHQLVVRLDASDQSMTELRSELDAAAANAIVLRTNIDRLNRQKGEAKELAAHQAAQINALQNTAEELQSTIKELIGSTSWKVTGLLRFASRLARGDRQQAMSSVRRRVVAVATRLGVHVPLAWSPLEPQVAALMPQAQEASRAPHGHSLLGSLGEGLVDLDGEAPLDSAPTGGIAVHAHIFYADVVGEFVDSLSQMPFAFDLFVSVPTETIRMACQTQFASLPKVHRLKTVVVPNRGRDLAPLFCTFGAELCNYTYMAHIHSKKSLYNGGATQGWREYLLGHLFGNPLQIQKILALLAGDTGNGLAYPQNYAMLPYWANTWLSNKAMGGAWCKRLGIADMPNGYFDYPAGSMFWARTDALRPLFEAGLTVEDFPLESGQQDATTAHCLERLFALTTRRSGYKTAILRDTHCPRPSAWGLDQYLNQTVDSVRAIVLEDRVQLIVFDIFDTLLLRPLLNPESTKAIVARKAGGGVVGSAYLKFRAEAESMARQHAGRDVGLDAIFVAFGSLAGLSVEAVTLLRHLEEDVERLSVSVRSDVANTLQFALAKGKRVVLASDMYLPRQVIESMLAAQGIVGWHALYVSSDIGLRKDTGDLYRHILAAESVQASHVLMIGDNEHSDIQIPCDMGMQVWHVMRPVDMARAVARLGPMVHRALNAGDLNEELTLGLILRNSLSPAFFHDLKSVDLVPPNYQSLGYTVLGPLVLSFVQWLGQQAASDGIEKLYFLSREGEFLKKVYDLWSVHEQGLPKSEYLVLSRRAVTVPMIRGIEEIEAIARTTYFENHVATFLLERYGLVLTEEEWADLAAQGLLSTEKMVEVFDSQIDHLKPLLSALVPRILAQADTERPGIMAYLKDMGLHAGVVLAVVDVGYSATIQGRLNQLLDRKVHGYYMMTDRRAEPIAQHFDVTAKGCFGQYVQFTPQASAMLTQSFDLEKMLSSDDAQIVRYSVAASGETTSETRLLSSDEVRCQPIRAALREGALKFINDAIDTRTRLLGDFVVPPGLARQLYETLVQQPSECEKALLRELVLDDYYCGRDLVN